MGAVTAVYTAVYSPDPDVAEWAREANGRVGSGRLRFRPRAVRERSGAGG
jgi:hypothetical protein